MDDAPQRYYAEKPLQSLKRLKSKSTWVELETARWSLPWEMVGILFLSRCVEQLRYCLRRADSEIAVK